jgi:hypothetical protein
MSIFSSFERSIGGILEGAFGSVFRSEVRPIEIAHKLAREMDEHRTTSVSRVYAPNEYLVWLSAADRARYAGVEDDVTDELCAYLLEHARRQELTLTSRPIVAFNTDERLSLGEFGIQARLVALDVERDDVGATGAPSGAAEQASAPPAQAGETMLHGASERARGPVRGAQHRGTARAFLLVRDKRLAVAPGGFVIGRSRGCDLVLDDPGVSRRHVEIRLADDGWIIRDLGSTNGIFLNRSHIDSAAVLRSGDRIELGETEMVFEAS